jgi:hypothetical protein
MTKTGRNEPCPCGSGKKYKKCCLDEDQAGRRAVNAITDHVLPPPDDQSASGWEEENSDPYMTEIYDRFEDADFDRRVALFEEVLSQGKGSTDDLFGLVDLLEQAVVTDASRREFNRCLAELRRQRPDCWEQDGAFYAHDYILNALALEETDEIDGYFLLASRQVGRHVDVYCNTIDLLAYHGRHKALTEGLRLALPQIRQAKGLMPWVPGDMASRLIDCEVLAWVETGETEADFSSLLPIAQGILPDLDMENILAYADHLAGRRPFPTKSLLDERNRLDLEQLSFLSSTFVGYLSRERGIPGISGLLTGREIYRYFFKRDAGELKAPKRSSVAAKFRGLKKGKGLSTHALMPDPDTLDRFIANQLHLFSRAYHAVAALAQCLPAWCDFLEERSLLEPGQAEGQLRPLVPLIEMLINILARDSGDPALAPAVLQAWTPIAGSRLG